MKQYNKIIWMLALMLIGSCATTGKIASSYDSQGNLRYYTELSIGNSKVIVLKNINTDSYYLHYYDESSSFKAFGEKLPIAPSKVYQPQYPTQPRMPYPASIVAHEYRNGERKSSYRITLSHPVAPVAPIAPTAPREPFRPTQATPPPRPIEPSRPSLPPRPSRPRPTTPPRQPRDSDSESEHSEYRRKLNDYNALIRDHDEYDRRVREHDQAMRNYEQAKRQYEINLRNYNDTLIRLERENRERMQNYEREYRLYEDELRRYNQAFRTYENEKRRYDQAYARYVIEKAAYDLEMTKNHARDVYELEIASYDLALRQYYIDLDDYPRAMAQYQRDLAVYEQRMVVYNQEMQAYQAAFARYIEASNAEIYRVSETLELWVTPAKGDATLLSFTMNVFDTEYRAPKWFVYTASDLLVNQIEILRTAKEVSFRVDDGVFGGPQQWQSLSPAQVKGLVKNLGKLQKM